MDDPQQPSHCRACKESSLLCNKCKIETYCSTQCQKADFPIHGLLCSKFADFDITPRPSKDHRRAILFGEYADEPEMIWVAGNATNADVGATTLQIEPHLVKHAYIKDKLPLKEELLNPICVCFRGEFNEERSNRSIARITSMGFGDHYTWQGCVVAYGSNRWGGREDLDMKDYRHVAEFFLSCDSRIAPQMVWSMSPKVKAVRVNCEGSQRYLNKPQFEQIELSSNHYIFEYNSTSDIADRIGIPIFTYRCYPIPSPSDDYDWHDNLYAEYLHLSCDPESKGWGTAIDHEEFDGTYCSFIMVRQDKKPLSLCAAEALCKYCLFEVGPFLELSAEEDGHNDENNVKRSGALSKEAILSLICRQTFFLYYLKIAREKEDGTQQKVDNASNPYE
ncbi:hypothetical protein F4808DRAFT_471157 [Astrocystis sublimbata]|nr:hypothetical protein F4808DRAFT_471157 [Astrocystis sublimbata]